MEHSDSKDSIKYDHTRFYNPYFEMRQANAVLLENARKNSDGCYYEFLTTILISAFSYEGFLNLLGSKLYEDWTSTKEKLCPDEKIEKITKTLDSHLDKGKSPYQTIHQMIKFRNDVVHSKPKYSEKLRSPKGDTIKEDWEKMCTLDFAEKCFNAVECFAKTIWKHAGYDEDYLLDQYEGRTSLPPQF